MENFNYVCTMTKKEIKRIAKLAKQKSETMENGTLYVYRLGKDFCIVTGGTHFDEDEYLGALTVMNENKPYTIKDFVEQINFMW